MPYNLVIMKVLSQGKYYCKFNKYNYYSNCYINRFILVTKLLDRYIMNGWMNGWMDGQLNGRDEPLMNALLRQPQGLPLLTSEKNINYLLDTIYNGLRYTDNTIISSSARTLNSLMRSSNN